MGQLVHRNKKGLVRALGLAMILTVVMPLSAEVLNRTIPAQVASHPCHGTPCQANGVKIGEVWQQTALIWTRATLRPERKLDGIPFRLQFPDKPPLPEGAGIEDMRDSVPGAPGQLRLRYAAVGDQREAVTAWVTVGEYTDYAHVFRLQELQAGTHYEMVSETRRGPSHPVSSEFHSRFQTAPDPDGIVPVTFSLSTCQSFTSRDSEDGHRIYRSMLSIEPDFFVHLGDIVYYDGPLPWVTNVALARYKWNRMYAMPLQRYFHARVASYFIKDDHDILRDDAWPGRTYRDLDWEDGLRIFREQLPVPRETERPYRTLRWGEDLQLWLLEGREFRSANNMVDGPDKSILGTRQRSWLEQTLRASDAAVKMVLSATPIVGPDRRNKNDNHANPGFAHEGAWLRKLLAGSDTIVISGDRHWQYVSTDPTTGLLEFGTGPASDAHAWGYPSRPAFEPDFLRIKGGFVSVRVSREGEHSVADIRHHDVEGRIVNEVRIRR